MGCACENNRPEPQIEIQKKPQELNQKILKSAINIQSHIRGYLLRKKLYNQYLDLIQNLQPNNSINESNNKILLYEVDNENLENINSSSREEEITNQDMSYLFSNYPPLKDGVKVLLKPSQLCENGTIYSGEWDEEGNRHGRGVQIYPDGSKYYGYWIKNAVNKKGKLVHKEGDVYEGEWVNEKAEDLGFI